MALQKRVEFQIAAQDLASAKLDKIRAATAKLQAQSLKYNDQARQITDSLGGQTTAFQKLGSSISNIASKSFESLKEAGKAAGIAIAGVTTAAAGLGVSAVKNSEKLSNSLLGLSAVAKAFGIDVMKAEEAARKLAEDGLMPVSDAAAGLKNLLASRFNLDEAIKLMNAFKDSAAFNRQGALAFGEAIVGATEGIKNQNSILVDNAGITKNLSVILKEAGYSQQDLMNVTSDAGVRQALYNGLLKEASTFQGNAAMSAETLTGKVQRIQTAYFNLSAEVGRTLVPVVTKLIQSLNNFIEAHRETFIKWAQSAIEWFSEMKAKIEPAIRVILEWMGKFFEEPERRKAALVGVFTAIGLAITAWAAAFVAASAGAIAIISAISVAVGFLYRVWTENWGGIQEKTKAVMSGMANFYNQYLLPLFDIIKTKVEQLAKWWGDNWFWIRDIFQGVWNQIKGIFDIVWAVFSGTFKVAIDLLTGNWKQAWEDLRNMFSGILNGLVTFLIGFVQTFIGVWKGYLDSVKQGAQTEWNNIANTFRNGWNNILQDFKAVWIAIKATYDMGLSGLKAAFSLAMDILSGNWSGAWEKVKTAFSSVWSGIKAIFFEVWEEIEKALAKGVNSLIGNINTLIEKINKLAGTKISLIGSIKNEPSKDVFGNIKAYATGTKFVPNDMIAQIHKGEAIIPAEYNPFVKHNAEHNTNNQDTQINNYRNQTNSPQNTINIDLRGATITDQDLITRVSQAINRELELSRFGIG